MNSLKIGVGRVTLLSAHRKAGEAADARICICVMGRDLPFLFRTSALDVSNWFQVHLSSFFL